MNQWPKTAIIVLYFRAGLRRPFILDICDQVQRYSEIVIIVNLQEIIISTPSNTTLPTQSHTLDSKIVPGRSKDLPV